jgi:hypothetical protein
MGHQKIRLFVLISKMGKWVFWAKLFLGALFTKVIFTFLKSVWKDGCFDTPFDLTKEKKFSSHSSVNVNFLWTKKKSPKWKQPLNISENVFYKHVLEFHRPSKFLCQTSGRQNHWSPLCIRDCWMICRRLSRGRMIWLLAHSPFPSKSSTGDTQEKLADRRVGGEGGWASSRIIITQESLVLYKSLNTLCGKYNLTHIRGIRRLQRDVVYLCWPLAPSYTSPNAGDGGGGWLRGLSQWVQLCTSRDMEPK